MATGRPRAAAKGPDPDLDARSPAASGFLSPSTNLDLRPCLFRELTRPLPPPPGVHRTTAASYVSVTMLYKVCGTDAVAICATESSPIHLPTASPKLLLSPTSHSPQGCSANRGGGGMALPPAASICPYRAATSCLFCRRRPATPTPPRGSPLDHPPTEHGARRRTRATTGLPPSLQNTSQKLPNVARSHSSAVTRSPLSDSSATGMEPLVVKPVHPHQQHRPRPRLWPSYVFQWATFSIHSTLSELCEAQAAVATVLTSHESRFHTSYRLRLIRLQHRKRGIMNEIVCTSWAPRKNDSYGIRGSAACCAECSGACIRLRGGR